MTKLYLFLTILLITSCGSRHNRIIEEPVRDLDWNVGDTTAPNGIYYYYYDYLSAPNSIDDLISFMEHESSVDSSSRWYFHYSIEYLKSNYDRLTFEKNNNIDGTEIIIRNDGEIVAEEHLSFPNIDGPKFLKPVIIDSSQQRIYNDSITAPLSNSLKKFYNKKRTYLERAKTSSQKIIKEGIIFEYKQHFLFNLISGDTLDIKKNTYYSDVYKCFDSLATNNGWNRIAVVFWDLTYTSATK